MQINGTIKELSTDCRWIVFFFTGTSPETRHYFQYTPANGKIIPVVVTDIQDYWERKSDVDPSEIPNWDCTRKATLVDYCLKRGEPVKWSQFCKPFMPFNEFCCLHGLCVVDLEESRREELRREYIIATNNYYHEQCDDHIDSQFPDWRRIEA